MRHQNHSKRLARKPYQSRLMVKNMVTSVLLYERIRTTKKRAQVIKGVVDHVITIGKDKQKDRAIRRINQYVFDQNACRKVMEVLAKRYESRTSGFSRVVPVGTRGGDGALLADLILIDAAVPLETEEKKVAAVSSKKALSKKVPAKPL
ncbi:50S ribosomal protein L17 [Candidatus Peribacteria bacterium]|nr:50S ribosomal protein L17 [Candidatus Peribacteria bacterium]